MNREKVKVAQAEVCETAKKMYSSGLVAGTWGNISSRIDDEYMVITPSGMDYERLNAEDMVVVDALKTVERQSKMSINYSDSELIVNKYQPNCLFYHNIDRADFRWGGIY